MRVLGFPLFLFFFVLFSSVYFIPPFFLEYSYTLFSYLDQMTWKTMRNRINCIGCVFGSMGDWPYRGQVPFFHLFTDLLCWYRILFSVNPPSMDRSQIASLTLAPVGLVWVIGQAIAFYFSHWTEFQVVICVGKMHGRLRVEFNFNS